MKRYLKSRSAISALALVAAVGAAQADQVKLLSADGTVNLTGDFVDFVDNSYVIRTALGELRLSAERVRCEGAACPTFETASADVSLKGSDAVGVGIMPLLLEGYAGFLDAEATITATEEDDQIIAAMVGDGGYGDELGSYLVTSARSTDGFEALLENTAQIAMAARRISPDEARALRGAGAGNMVSPSQEHIIAVDSLVVVTHPDNPVQSLTVEELRDIYEGKITNWSKVGGPDMEIRTVVRPFEADTRVVFNDVVFEGDEAPIIRNSVIAVNNTDAASAVNKVPGAIGYVGYAFQRGSKPVSIVNRCGLTMTPDAFSARTEEYAMQRRLYLYNRVDNTDETTSEFLQYAKSPAADAVIRKAGFIDLGVARQAQPLNGDRARMLLDPNADAYEGTVMREMLGTMVDYDRLSTTFRFRTGASKLDERGIVDMGRLAEYLEDLPAGSEVLFVGFTDDVGSFDANRNLSVERAQQVMDEMDAFAGRRLPNIEMAATGFGEVAPSGCNTTDRGRGINRRVEVWIKSAG